MPARRSALPTQPLWDLSADIRLDITYTAATAPQGRLYVTRWSGTNGEGGDFEAIYVCVGLIRGGQPAGLEIFEIDDFTAARARFEALGVDRDDRDSADFSYR